MRQIIGWELESVKQNKSAASDSELSHKAKMMSNQSNLLITQCEQKRVQSWSNAAKPKRVGPAAESVGGNQNATCVQNSRRRVKKKEKNHMTRGASLTVTLLAVVQEASQGKDHTQSQSSPTDGQLVFLRLREGRIYPEPSCTHNQRGEWDRWVKRETPEWYGWATQTCSSGAFQIHNVTEHLEKYLAPARPPL